MKKIGPNLYAATEKRVPLTPGGSVFPYVFGYMMVTFPFREARPFAFTFTDLKMPAGSRGSRGPADWQAPAPLEVTGVAEQMAQFGTGVSIAYKQGVVEQGSYLLGLKFSSGPVSNLEEATQGFELGLQEVNFRIPKFVGGIQIGKESDNLFVMKGRLTQGRLQLVEGFRVVKAAGGHWGIRPIAGELIDFYQPRLPTKK
jgi:hypothetical protein